MKKTTPFFALLALTFSLLSSVSLHAQTPGGTLPEAAENYDSGFRLGFGISAGPVFDDPFSWGLGGDARLQYDLTKFTSFTLTTGYTHFFAKSEFEDAGAEDLGFIPVKLGFKGFVVGEELYLLGEVGGAFDVTSDNSQSSVLLAPGIGYATRSIDLSARYEYFPNWETGPGEKGVGFLALRLAYGFKL
ncbi:MAG TPA: hypothetical protein VK183_13555 [Flavobacterium sp.]|nr:hypothetical protein [Flavobacterium sp.]